MSGEQYRLWLIGLAPERLRKECRDRIDYHRRLHGRDREREGVSGCYQLCWRECEQRGRQDLWRAALDDVRAERRALDASNRAASDRLLGRSPPHPQPPEEQMANLNKVMLIGRLTRDPETRTFSNGGKVANFGFAVNNRKKNADGTWGEDPVFLDCKAFNRETGRKLADLVEQHMRKGAQFYVEGHLVFEQWEKDGQKRTALRVVMDDFQFLEPRQDGGAPRAQAPAQGQKAAQTAYADHSAPSDDEIPF
jgi:single-strand DNA-binding protein